jgi:deoxyribose-phosphate aldolase
MITDANSNVEIGTVIDFPEVWAWAKLNEANRRSIQDGADDLDFVCNYEAFKGNGDLLKEEILKCPIRIGKQ